MKTTVVSRCLSFAICLACIGGGSSCRSQESLQPPVAVASAAATKLPAEAAGFRANPAPAAVSSYAVSTPRVADRSYFLLNGLQLGMSVFDVELTQHCISVDKCRETNPFLPSSQAGKLGVNFAIAGYQGVLSYWLKRRHSKAWWVPLIAGTAVHSVGVATGFEHY